MLKQALEEELFGSQSSSSGAFESNHDKQSACTNEHKERLVQENSLATNSQASSSSSGFDSTPQMPVPPVGNKGLGRSLHNHSTLTTTNKRMDATKLHYSVRSSESDATAGGSDSPTSNSTTSGTRVNASAKGSSATASENGTAVRGPGTAYLPAEDAYIVELYQSCLRGEQTVTQVTQTAAAALHRTAKGIRDHIDKLRRTPDWSGQLPVVPIAARSRACTARLSKRNLNRSFTSGNGAVGHKRPAHESTNSVGSDNSTECTHAQRKRMTGTTADSSVDVAIRKAIENLGPHELSPTLDSLTRSLGLPRSTVYSHAVRRGYWVPGTARARHGRGAVRLEPKALSTSIGSEASRQVVVIGRDTGAATNAERLFTAQEDAAMLRVYQTDLQSRSNNGNGESSASYKAGPKIRMVVVADLARTLNRPIGQIKRRLEELLAEEHHL